MSVDPPAIRVFLLVNAEGVGRVERPLQTLGGQIARITQDAEVFPVPGVKATEFGHGQAMGVEMFRPEDASIAGYVHGQAAIMPLAHPGSRGLKASSKH